MESHLPIAALALETGIAKDTLRVWERRYGFPQPVRGPRGDRLYPVQQVARLRQIRRLLDQGFRPGQLLTLDAEQLTQTLDQHAAIADAEPELIRLLRQHDDAGLRQQLRTRLLQDGLRRFASLSAVSMLESIGNAWARGDLEVFEEHHFSAHLDGVLREAIVQLPAGSETPRILLTTLPGEPHTLGLLLAHALMRLAGAACIWLGPQTPESQIIAAARAFRVDIVALSFSEYVDSATARVGMRQARLHLPPATALWCGGRGAHRLRRLPAGVDVFRTLEQLDRALAARASTTGGN